MLSQVTEEISSLTSCAEVRLLEAGEATPSGCAPAVIDATTTVQLLLAGILDPHKEIEKLQKEKVCPASCTPSRRLCRTTFLVVFGISPTLLGSWVKHKTDMETTQVPLWLLNLENFGHWLLLVHFREHSNS